MLTDEQLAEMERANIYTVPCIELKAYVTLLVAEVRRLKACPATYPPFGLPATASYVHPFEPAHAAAFDDGFVAPPAEFVNPDSGDCDAAHVIGGEG